MAQILIVDHDITQILVGGETTGDRQVFGRVLSACIDSWLPAASCQWTMNS